MLWKHRTTFGHVSKLWYIAGIGIYFISKMLREKIFGLDNHPDRSENIMVSPEKCILLKNRLLNESFFLLKKLLNHGFFSEERDNKISKYWSNQIHLDSVRLFKMKQTSIKFQRWSRPTSLQYFLLRLLKRVLHLLSYPQDTS